MAVVAKKQKTFRNLSHLRHQCYRLRMIFYFRRDQELYVLPELRNRQIMQLSTHTNV